MTVFDDDQDMRAEDELLLTGRAVPGDRALVDLLDSLRTLADAPAPAPTAQLAALRDGGLRPQPAPLPVPVRRGRAVRGRAAAAGRWVAGLGLAGKVVLGAGIAMAGVTGAATIPAVPDVVQQPAHTILTDVGRAFGGAGGSVPAPSPSSSTTAPGRDDDAPRATVTEGAGSDDRGGPGSVDKGSPSGTKPEGTGQPNDGEHPHPQVPGRSGTGDGGSTGVPGAPSTDRRSSGSSGSSGQGSSGDQGPATQEGAATGSDGWMTRKQDAAPARSPQPSSSPTPRVDQSPSPSASEG